MAVLIAPDAYSGPLTAVAAVEAMARGWQRNDPGAEPARRPMSAGGPGMLDVVHAARGGRLLSVTVDGPLGVAVPAGILHVPGRRGGTVYIEAAQVLGRHLVPSDLQWQAASGGSSAGLGQALLLALATGAGRIVVGCDAAASHDGGAGVLAVLAHAAGQTVSERLREGALGLSALVETDMRDLARVMDLLGDREIVVATTDTSPLRGLHGAGAALAQRPGITPEAAQELDRALGHFAGLLQEATPEQLPGRRGGGSRNPLPLAGASPVPGTSSTGAAHDHGAHDHGAHGHGSSSRRGAADRAAGSGSGGGVAFLLGALGARVVEGPPAIAAEVDLASQVARADVVLTGTAMLDSAALTSSVVGTVAGEAMRIGLPVVVIAEQVRTSRRENAQLGISAAYEIAAPESSGRENPGNELASYETSGGRQGTAVAELEAFTQRIARTWGRVA